MQRLSTKAGMHEKLTSSNVQSLRDGRQTWLIDQSTFSEEDKMGDCVKKEIEKRRKRVRGREELRRKRLSAGSDGHTAGHGRKMAG